MKDNMTVQSEVVLMKLNDGAEVVGEAVVSNEGFSLKNPCIMQVMHQGGKLETKATMKFVKYAPFAKDDTIMISSYVWISKALTDIENAYNKQFSRIIVPDTQLQLF